MYEVWKILLDKTSSGIALLLLSPPCLVIAALIKLTSRGPVFFTQTGLGKNAKPFNFLKFRTMYAGDEYMYASGFAKDVIDKKYGDIGINPTFKLKNDPRITCIGRVLRMTGLDELPQLLNVFKGDMSLVGPRLAFPFEYAVYKDWHKERLSVKPGITGLWQVAGRCSSTFDEMVKLDIEYVRKRSALMDLKILFKTPFVVFSVKGAGFR